MSAAESNLWAQGEVVEAGVVNSVVQPALTATPMPTDIAGQSEPAIEVIGEAGARATRIRFQAAAHREHSSWKRAVHIGAGKKEGVSAEKLPFGSWLILCCASAADEKCEDRAFPASP